MNKLLKEFLFYILEEKKKSGDKVNPEAKARQDAIDQGYTHIEKSRGYWSKSGQPPAEATTRGGKFRLLTPDEKKALASGGGQQPTTPTPQEQPPTVPDDKKKRLSSQEQQTRKQEIGDQFISLVNGLPQTREDLAAFLIDNDIQFKMEGKNPNRFYCLSGLTAANRLFLTLKPSEQKALYEKIRGANIEVAIRGKQNPLAPSTLIPQERHQTLSEASRAYSDGSIVIGETRIEQPEQINDFVNSRLEEWKRDHPEDAQDEQKIEDVTRKLVAIGNSIFQRNRLLREMIDNNEPVAVYETNEDKAEYRNMVRDAALKIADSGEVKAGITQLFETLEGTTDETLAKEVLEEIFALAETDTKLGKNMPALAEHLSCMYEMARGRTVIMPTRDNNVSVDVISLSPVRLGDNPTVDDLLNNMSMINVGVAVKRAIGGANSIIDTTELSTYEDHENTITSLRALSNPNDLFDPTTTKQATERIRDTIENNLDTVRDYFGLNPDIYSDTDSVMKALENGSVECDENGVVIPRSEPLAPAKDMEEGENRSMYRTYFTMLAAWEAIFNTRVIGQGFESHSWTSIQRNRKGERVGGGLKTANGIDRLAKQRRAPFKKNRTNSHGIVQPDTAVSFNVITSEDRLRTGNPC